MQDLFIIPDETIISKIYLFRDQKVMIDSDLAKLYDVETRVLNQALKRNIKRFPSDFMFQLSEPEFENLKNQKSTQSWGGRRTNPFVFTEHGILMLSSILNSDKAININTQIIRIFIKMREMLLTHKDILIELDKIKQTIDGHEDRMDLVYNYLKQFMHDQKHPRKTIGYKKGE